MNCTKKMGAVKNSPKEKCTDLQLLANAHKLLNVMKEEEISIAELARISGVPECTILDIMAGIKEPEF